MVAAEKPPLLTTKRSDAAPAALRQRRIAFVLEGLPIARYDKLNNAG